MNLGYIFISVFLFSIAVYWLIPKQKHRNTFLALVSLVFIFLIDRTAFAVVLILTFYTFVFSFLISKSGKKSFYHKLSITGIVLVLIFFKYSGFFDSYISCFLTFFSARGTHPFEKILIPLGLSYITFKYISYLTDLYWGLNKRAALFELLFYGSFFTIFLSGPIERFERLEKQMSVERITFSSSFVYESFERIAFGMFKKFVLADWLGYYISNVWKNSDEYSLFWKALALLGFSFQLYFDFAGYSDIAIGTSKMFGFKIIENFNYPYLRENISTFWRNWHISLSDWIRDYIFFPLSRFSSKKIWVLFFVPLIAMGICGIWHGSEIRFLYWGLYHGFGISVYQFWNMFKKKRKKLTAITNTAVFNYLAVVITFIFVTIGWLFFI